jgi:hypothetical protein
MRSLRLLSFACVVGSAAGCTAILGEYSLSSSSGGGDGGPAADSSVDSSMDATNDAGGEGATTMDSGAPEGSPSSDGGPGEGGSSEGGPPEAGKEAGPPMSCSIAKSEQRPLTIDGGTIAADNLYVFNTSQTNVLAIVKTSTPPSVAFGIRSDRPGDAPDIVQFAGAGYARFQSASRAAGNGNTLVLAQDTTTGENLLYVWPDGTSISSNPTSTSNPAAPLGVVKIVQTASGAFYGEANQLAGTNPAGVYIDNEPMPLAPAYMSGTAISNQDDTGLTDSERAYLTSGGDVSLLYYGSDKLMHQAVFAPGMTTPSVNRLFFPGNLLPLSWQRNGQNVEIMVVEGTDAGTFQLNSGSIPEANIGTFDPTTALKPANAAPSVMSQPCYATWPGNFLALLPDVAGGLDVIVIDPATGQVTYTQDAPNNLLNSDTSIVACALSLASVTATQINFDLIWTDNAGGGGQTLNFAPVICTP